MISDMLFRMFDYGLGAFDDGIPSVDFPGCW